MTDQIDSLLGIDEDLDPELERHCVDTEIGMCIKHPLVFSIMHNPVMNAMVNRAFNAKKKGIARALDDKNWDKYVWLHERPYRLDAFLDVEHHMSDRQYWELAGHIWVDSENIHQSLDQWRDIFEDNARGDQQYFMSEDDRKFMRLSPSRGGLNPVFTVYRGFSQPGCEDGFSWTLSYDTAVWFANRLCHSDETPMLATGTLSARDVFAYMSGRGEREIVCLPENVCGIEIEVLG